MPADKKYRMSQLLKVSIIMMLTAGVLVVTVAAIGNGEKEKIENIKINIRSSHDKDFVTNADIMQSLIKASGNSLKNQPIGSLNLTSLENHLLKNPWIRKAELFVDNNRTLRVNVEESTPVARVFTTDGRSFYVSASSEVLPLSDRYSARVPVFTDFPAFRKKPDSSLMAGVFTLGSFILNDKFWMSQIDQIAITENEKFVMIPKLGNQVVRFGNSEDHEEKFRKLFAFYKQVQEYSGWNKYKAIDLQFKGQVVAERRDASEIKADSLAAIRIMKNIIENAKKKINDSTQIQLPDNDGTDKPVVRVTSPKTTGAPPKPTTVSPEPSDSDNPHSLLKADSPGDEKKIEPKKEEKKAEPVKKKQVKPEKIKKEETEKRVPKAVMPTKNKSDDNK